MPADGTRPQDGRADERTRTAFLLQLRVINHVLQGFARACKSRISKPLSFLCFAPCCTVLRSRWCQSGVDVALAFAYLCNCWAQCKPSSHHHCDSGLFRQFPPSMIDKQLRRSDAQRLLAWPLSIFQRGSARSCISGILYHSPGARERFEQGIGELRCDLPVFIQLRI
jgi:hypothetical protein